LHLRAIAGTSERFLPRSWHLIASRGAFAGPTACNQGDGHMKFVGFRGYRICHHSKGLCCRGFWDAHKDEFPAGQIAQRLRLVQFVTEDTLT